MKLTIKYMFMVSIMSVIWTILDLLVHGETSPRIVDNLMMMLFFAIFVSEFNDKSNDDGWISISEKYPPIGQRVLIAYRLNGKYETIISSYHEHPLTKILEFDLPPGLFFQQNVIAWRRLPIFLDENKNLSEVEK